MKRYTLDFFGHGVDPEMKEDDEGPYVLFRDIQATITTAANPDTVARLVEALRAIVKDDAKHDRPIPWLLIHEANNALHMAQLPVVQASSPDAIFVLRRYMSAVDGYYRNDPSPETVGEKCAEMVLAHEEAEKIVSGSNFPVVPGSEDVETIRFAITDRHRRISNVISSAFQANIDSERNIALASLDRLAAAAGRKE